MKINKILIGSILFLVIGCKKETGYPNTNKEDKANFNGDYDIAAKAISQYDNKEIELYYAITVKNDKSALLSINAEQVQDYWCEGPYTLYNQDNIIHARGKCDQNDLDDFYIKHEDNKYFIKSKRFINQNWQELHKK